MIHSTRNTRLATLLIAAAGLGAVAPGAAPASNGSASQDQFYVNPSTGYATPARAGDAAETKDYSRNAATGDYAHGPLPPSAPGKDDSKNGATGDYVPAESQPAVDEPASTGGFDWPSAGIGAAAVGGLMLILLAATIGVGRRGRGPLVRRGGARA